MACCIFILMWVQDELNFDRYNEKVHNIYRVEEDQYYSGEVYHVTVTPYPSGPVWKEEIPEIEDACRYQWPSGMLFRYGEKAFYEGGCVAVDESFFSMFSFPLIKGDKQTLLTEPFSTVLTDETAKKYFGNEDPIGKILMVNNKYEFTIKILPIGSSFPKYFFAVSSVRTVENGSVRSVCLSPLISGNENIEKKDSSTATQP